MDPLVVLVLMVWVAILAFLMGRAMPARAERPRVPEVRDSDVEWRLDSLKQSLCSEMRRIEVLTNIRLDHLQRQIKNG